MGIIRVLPELVANKIAAGEVVERPASVVKELVENALDAGARTVGVVVRHGGKSLVSVKDDGCGMDREDATACLNRHATSKLSDVEDIENVETLGFRGEALPSIASVSRFTLTTRRQGKETGVRVAVAGGAVETVREAAADPGTAVDVADLFFNTPARKKFLKSNAAENTAIADVFNTLSLARRDVFFTLSRDGTTVASYEACNGLLERIKQVFPPDYSSQLFPIAISKPDFEVSGYIGTPDNSRVNRTGQKLFINSRPVQSISLSAALSRAYEEFLPRGRFPVAVLFFAVDRSFVDVNVHPAKKEVRVRSERFFQDVLVSAIKAVLRERGRGARPSEGHFGSAPGAPRFVAEKARAPFFSSAGERPPAWVPAAPRQLPYALPRQARQQDTAAAPPAGGAASALSEKPFGIRRILGQILGTYIFAETESGLVVFDQHAAHERILYEKLYHALTVGPAASQGLVFPVTLHLNLQEAPIMETHLGDFCKMGFGINSLGGGAYAVDAVPTDLGDADAAGVLRDTLHELMDGAVPRAWRSRQEMLAAVLACKTHSVKAGRRLETAEMLQLVVSLSDTDNPHSCPHGRPTFFVISREEIEKRFRRR